MTPEKDLPARNAHIARTLTVLAVVCDLLALTPIFLGPASDSPWVGLLCLFAVVGLVTSIIGMAYARRCPNPRPVGPFVMMVMSLIIVLGYALLLYGLMQLAHKR